MKDLHDLPKLRDSLSYIYVEHAILNQKNQAIEYLKKDEGRVMIPVASLSLLMLGPGTSISHAAIRTLSENGCMVMWVGEQSTKFYAYGHGETRKSYRLLKQAELASDPKRRLKIVRKMYQMRFKEKLDPALSLQQIRGMEGARIRNAYADAAAAHHVLWHSRRYDRSNWHNATPINRAISAANALLYGICAAAIVAGGYSPAIGFIHTGRKLSFVYDIGDLYKVELTIPVAFRTVSESEFHVEKRVRTTLREKFREAKLLKRILPDIDNILKIKNPDGNELQDADRETSLPGPLWDPEDKT